MNSATKVFSIPELLELILLALPCDNVHQELLSARTLILSRTTSRTWHSLLSSSVSLRKRLYYPTPLDASESSIWLTKTPFPPSRPNPWIPDLLLNQRSWGSAYPFEVHQEAFGGGMGGNQPRFWTFSFEISRNQFQRLPPCGPWREMLVASPPFTDFWYTRCLYELGSGRAPFVTHLDYNPRVPKWQQKYSKNCHGGVTLGDVVDAVRELFEKYSGVKFVMIESVRRLDGDLRLDRPTEKGYVPGMSAERAHGWQRGL